jgi:RNase P subunit RPR2
MEKGATTTDKAAHRLYDAKLHRTPQRVACANCGHLLATAYHEERLYSVSCATCGTITLAKARNPYEAARRVGFAMTMEGRP